MSAEKIQVEGEDCLIAITRDITERKNAERALAQSEERFSKVFRSSPDSISISSLEEGRYLDVKAYASYCTSLVGSEADRRTRF